MRRVLYSLLWHLILPLVLLRLLWRARRQPDYLHHLGERFGAAPRPLHAPYIWVHAVSVGETRAAQPLIRALLDRYPHHDILLTHMTPTGRATGKELFGKELRIHQSYLPYELPWAIARFLRRTKPALGIIMETEIWPNLLAACADRRIPVALANARLSERSARGYRRLGRLASEAVAGFSMIGAQTEPDAARLRQLGARYVAVTGNLKFDMAAPESMQTLGLQFRDGCAGRPVIVFGCSRDGEEDAFLQAFARQAGPAVLLVLVPRHPQRFEEVEDMVRRRGLRIACRSQGLPIAADTQVWLGDSMGELFAYYAMADVAIIGGSWQPLGGHNLIEACAVGAPVIVGPHTFNFAEATDKAITAGAALRCEDAETAMREAIMLLADEALRTQMSQAARQFARAHRGATARTMAELEVLLPVDESTVVPPAHHGIPDL